MRKIFLILALSTLLLAPAATANAQVTFGVRIGQPPAPRGYVVPARPYPNSTWVEGYWYPQGGRYAWHNGYWTNPPYAGAYWVAPYHSGGRYVPGQWEGDRGVVRHDHRWDRADQRDENRNPRSNGRGRGDN